MKKINIIAFIFIICGCTGIEQRISTAQKIAVPAGLQPIHFNTSPFKLFGYGRVKVRKKSLVVFIEGDGLAYITKSRPSSNPTPTDPISLRLAAVSSNSNVLYIGRPCQYLKISSQKNCAQKYWTTARFSEEVITSVNQAVDIGMKMTNAQVVHLVGYSGGGAVAALIAARRSDIGSLRTLAGYLDHKTLNHKRKVTQLYQSLDPIAIAASIRHIPQIHYSGSSDRVIPQWVATNFYRATDNASCVKTRVVEANHIKGWVALWRSIGHNIPSCD